jgi:DNA-binding FrmR family transcriptional regulator
VPDARVRRRQGPGPDPTAPDRGPGPGLQRLVDQDTYCIDVLTQISAVDKALKGVAVTLLDGHLRHCVRDGMAAGGRDAEAIVTEASDAIARLVRA